MAKRPCKRLDTSAVVVKSNQLIEASYHLSLAEQRLLLLTIARLDGSAPLEPGIPHIITAAELADVFGIPLKQAYELIRDAAAKIYARSVVIYRSDGKDPTLDCTHTRWISTIDYVHSEGRISFYFAPGILPFISQLKREFSQYRLTHIARLTSVYAIRLYELLIQWRGRGEREVELIWLRERLQLEGKHANIRELKRWVIKPAIDQINEHSDLWVKWDQRKAGRSVVAFTFTFGPKSENTEKTADPEKPAPKKRMTQKEMERAARPGESWEELKRRLGVGR
jgi:plasmid replication initiation protein